MDSLPAWLLGLAPVLLALLAAVGWLLNGRRPKPKPAPPPAIIAEIEGAHVRQVERAEAEAAEVVADAARVDALPPRERNAAIGARLRK